MPLTPCPDTIRSANVDEISCSVSSLGRMYGPIPSFDRQPPCFRRTGIGNPAPHMAVLLPIRVE